MVFFVNGDPGRTGHFLYCQYVTLSNPINWAIEIIEEFRICPTFFYRLSLYKLYSFCSRDNFLIMSILSSIDTGFVNPALRAWRLMPTGNIIWQLKANPDLGREIHHAAFMSLESFKETMYKLSVHADCLQTEQDKIKQLRIARKVAIQQRNMNGVSDHMLKMYDQHIKNIDWLLKTLTQGWSQNMFPMIEG